MKREIRPDDQGGLITDIAINLDAGGWGVQRYSTRLSFSISLGTSEPFTMTTLITSAKTGTGNKGFPEQRREVSRFYHIE